MGSERTAWHPLLVVLLRALLPRDAWDVVGEYQLTREPLRIDVVVLRRKHAAILPSTLLPSLVAGLADHTLVHFKGPTDELDRDDATMLLAYAMLYLVTTSLASPSGLGLRVVAPSLTPRFRAQVLALGGALDPVSEGLHEGTLGALPLRVVETSVVGGHEGEHLLYAFSPRFLKDPGGVAPLDPQEATLYRFLYQQVEQFKKQRGALMLKDQQLASESYRKALQELVSVAPHDMLLQLLTPEERIAGLKPEERVAGLKPEERIAGLKPEERIAGLKPEERVADLAEGERVLLLSDAALGALPDSYLATLPQDVQARIRVRLRR